MQISAEARRERRCTFDRRQCRDQSSQKRTEPEPFRHRDEHAGTGIAEDSGLPTSILLDLGALHRRIDRNRDRTGIKDAEEGREKLRCPSGA